MPYRTLWDKISQILAHLEGNYHKKFKSHRVFRPFYNRFYEEININHTLLWFSQASYIKKKDFRLYRESPKVKVMFKKISQNFVKSPLKFCLISDFSPQLMACMQKVNILPRVGQGWALICPLFFTCISGLLNYQILLCVHEQVNGQTPLVQSRLTCLKMDFFLISWRKHMFWYWLEVPHQGTSNEYPQHNVF